jgi:hypothetical protein
MRASSTQVTGDAYVDAVGLTDMIHELLTSILTAALVIFGLIAILFRSVRIGLITIPPNVIPLVVTFGYMGLRKFDLNAGNVIVFTISLGIAVDNTIHYILRFREEYAKDPHMERATWKTMLGKGQPMCLSTSVDRDRFGGAPLVRFRPHPPVCRADDRDADRCFGRGAYSCCRPAWLCCGNGPFRKRNARRLRAGVAAAARRAYSRSPAKLTAPLSPPPKTDVIDQ